MHLPIISVGEPRNVRERVPGLGVGGRGCRRKDESLFGCVRHAAVELLLCRRTGPSATVTTGYLLCHSERAPMVMSLKSLSFGLLLLCGLVLGDRVSCSVRGGIQHSYPTAGGPSFGDEIYFLPRRTAGGFWWQSRLTAVDGQPTAVTGWLVLCGGRSAPEAGGFFFSFCIKGCPWEGGGGAHSTLTQSSPSDCGPLRGHRRCVRAPQRFHVRRVRRHWGWGWGPHNAAQCTAGAGAAIAGGRPRPRAPTKARRAAVRGPAHYYAVAVAGPSLRNEAVFVFPH